MSDSFLGEIRLFAGSFAPAKWAFCNGQILPIRTNTELFSIIGTMYGGNGQTTFQLPNLQGRVPMSFGQGPSLTNRNIGDADGAETVSLADSQVLPNHSHTASAVAGAGSSASPGGSVWAKTVPPSRGGASLNLYSPTSNTTMSPMALNVAGSSQPHENRQPYVGLNYIISLEGNFPPRG